MQIISEKNFQDMKFVYFPFRAFRKEMLIYIRQLNFDILNFKGITKKSRYRKSLYFDYFS